MRLNLESFLRKISGINGENPTILDGTVLPREKAEEFLKTHGLSLIDLKPIEGNSLDEYFNDTLYDICFRNMVVHKLKGKDVLYAEVGVQYKKLPYEPQLTLVGRLLRDSNLLTVPNTTRDIPRYFVASATLNTGE